MTSRCAAFSAAEKRGAREMETLGRTWTEEELQYEASDKYHRSLLEGLGLCEESKTVNSAAVMPEEIGQEEYTEMLEGAAREKFWSLAATVNYVRLD